MKPEVTKARWRLPLMARIKKALTVLALLAFGLGLGYCWQFLMQ